MTMAYWIYSGIIGSLVRTCWSYFAKTIGLAKFFILQVDASLFLKKAEATTAIGNLVGFIISLAVGGGIGVAIGLLFEWRGTSYYILKGWGVGIAAWLLFYGLTFHNLPFLAPVATSDPLSVISQFIGHSIFGSVTALVYVKFFLPREPAKHSEGGH